MNSLLRGNGFIKSIRLTVWVFEPRPPFIEFTELDSGVFCFTREDLRGFCREDDAIIKNLAGLGRLRANSYVFCFMPQ